MAAKRAKGAMNLPNSVFVGKGGIICYRCGKGDHVLRDCPLPYTATLAFAPRKGKSTSKGKNKGTFVADEEQFGGQVHTEDDPSTGIDQVNLASPETVESHETMGRSNSQDHQISGMRENQRLSGWFGEHSAHDAYTAQCMDGEEWLYFDMETESSALKRNESQNPMPFIDCGASRTVVGVPWLLRWFKVGDSNELPILKPISRMFRFGSQSQFKSQGCIVIKGSVVGKTKERGDITRVIAIEAGVISLNIPFLVSNVALCNLRAKN